MIKNIENLQISSIKNVIGKKKKKSKNFTINKNRTIKILINQSLECPV